MKFRDSADTAAAVLALYLLCFAVMVWAVCKVTWAVDLPGMSVAQ